MILRSQTTEMELRWFCLKHNRTLDVPICCECTDDMNARTDRLNRITRMAWAVALWLLLFALLWWMKP